VKIITVMLLPTLLIIMLILLLLVGGWEVGAYLDGLEEEGHVDRMGMTRLQRQPEVIICKVMFAILVYQEKY
jgi:hypothetical protein